MTKMTGSASDSAALRAVLAELGEEAVTELA